MLGSLHLKVQLFIILLFIYIKIKGGNNFDSNILMGTSTHAPAYAGYSFKDDCFLDKPIISRQDYDELQYCNDPPEYGSPASDKFNCESNCDISDYNLECDNEPGYTDEYKLDDEEDDDDLDDDIDGLEFKPNTLKEFSGYCPIKPSCAVSKRLHPCKQQKKQKNFMEKICLKKPGRKQANKKCGGDTKCISNLKFGKHGYDICPESVLEKYGLEGGFKKVKDIQNKFSDGTIYLYRPPVFKIIQDNSHSSGNTSCNNETVLKELERSMNNPKIWNVCVI